MVVCSQMFSPLLRLILAAALQQPGTTSTLVFAKGHAFRVYSSGRIEKTSFEFGEGGPHRADLGRGSTDPLLSPDGRYLAFTKNNDLWLFDSETGKRRQLTKIAVEPTKRFNGASVLTSAWSPDSKEILYYVDEEIPLAGEGGQEVAYPQAIRKPIQFGFHIYNLPLGRSRSVNIPHTGIDDHDSNTLYYQAWLRDGTYIVTDASGTTGVFIVDPKSGRIQPIATGTGALDFGQIAASSDGKFIVSTRAVGDRSKIVKIDLPTEDITTLSPEGTFAEYQWPRISPSGRHISYARIVHSPPTSQETAFIVDGKVIFHTNGPQQPAPLMQWIDDNTIAVSDRDDIIIVNAQNGAEINRYKVIGR
jgi:Tol biopolymer transport system component